MWSTTLKSSRSTTNKSRSTIKFWSTPGQQFCQFGSSSLVQLSQLETKVRKLFLFSCPSLFPFSYSSFLDVLFLAVCWIVLVQVAPCFAEWNWNLSLSRLFLGAAWWLVGSVVMIFAWFDSVRAWLRVVEQAPCPPRVECSSREVMMITTSTQRRRRSTRDNRQPETGNQINIMWTYNIFLWWFEPSPPSEHPTCTKKNISKKPLHFISSIHSFKKLIPSNTHSLTHQKSWKVLKMVTKGYGSASTWALNR